MHHGESYDNSIELPAVPVCVCCTACNRLAVAFHMTGDILLYMHVG